jgi:hypothetical protein
MTLPPMPADRRRRSSLPSERLFAARLEHTRGIRRAMAAGFELDPAARQAGYVDALSGEFRLSVDDILHEEHIDALAYLQGWLAGKRFRKNPIGG